MYYTYDFDISNRKRYTPIEQKALDKIFMKKSSHYILPAWCEEFTQEFMRCYSDSQLKSLFSHYLIKLEPLKHIDQYTSAQKKKLSSKFYSLLSGYVFSEKELTAAFWKLVPPGVQKTAADSIWYLHSLDRKKMTQIAGEDPIISKTRDNWNMMVNSTRTIKPDFHLFQVLVQENYSGQYSRRKLNELYTYYFYIPSFLGEAILPLLPRPQDYEFHPLSPADVKKILKKKAGVIFEDNGEILKRIKLINQYIEQKNITYLKNGNPGKKSLRDFEQICQVQPFFPGEEDSVYYLRCRLLIQIMNYYRGETDPYIPADQLIKNIFDSFTADTDRKKKVYSLINELSYLKGNKSSAYDKERQEEFVTNLIAVFKNIPPGEWISIENLYNYLITRRSNPIPLNSDSLEFEELYINLQDYFDKEKSNRYPVTFKNVRVAVIEPLIRLFINMMASLGLMDIITGAPQNMKLRDKGKLYLSLFDGLKGFRLNDMGAFVLGLKESPGEGEQEQQGQIILDEKNLILTLEGEDKIKELFLQRIAVPVKTGVFKVSYTSFLQDCKTSKALQEKIDFFHKNISTDPPEVWKNFLHEILAKITPLEQEKGFLMFRIKNSRELLQRLTGDQVLSKLIIKAENHRILMKKEDYPRVKKRLEEFGYLL